MAAIVRKDIPDCIECIFYDFDGVMTDNKVLVLQDGTEAAFANRSDGLAIAKLCEIGVQQLIVSTEKNPIVIHRAAKLNIPVANGVNDKGKYIKEYCELKNIDLSNTIFFGNDINDLSAFEMVGFRCAPADAEPEILELANWISCKNGGEGVIRDFYRHYVQEYMISTTRLM